MDPSVQLGMFLGCHWTTQSTVVSSMIYQSKDTVHMEANIHYLKLLFRLTSCLLLEFMSTGLQENVIIAFFKETLLSCGIGLILFFPGEPFLVCLPTDLSVHSQIKLLK